MGKKDQGATASHDRYQAIPRALVFLRNGNDILLIKGSAAKRIWANLYNGVGGHIERHEDILTAARREVLEETGLSPVQLELAAIVNIDAGRPDPGIIMFVFVGWSPERLVKSSPEGELHWFPVKTLTELNLVEDLPWLLPEVIGRAQGSQPLFLHYSYDGEDTLIIRPALASG